MFEESLREGRLVEASYMYCMPSSSRDVMLGPEEALSLPARPRMDRASSSSVLDIPRYADGFSFSYGGLFK